MSCATRGMKSISANPIEGKESHMESFDRRDFLRGSVAMAAGAAFAGLAGCSPSKQMESDSEQMPVDLREADFRYSAVERTPVTKFAGEETYDIVVIGAGCAGVPAVLTAVEEGASVACLQKEVAVSANGNGASFVLKSKSTPAGIARWMSDWAKLNDWRVNTELFKYYVEHSEEAVTWVVSEGRAAGVKPVDYQTDSSIRYDDGGLAAICDVTQASNQSLMMALAKKAEESGAIFHYGTPCVQLVQEEDGTVTGAIGRNNDGTYVKLNAKKGVILAAGDYMNNTSMLDRNLRDGNMFPLCLVNHTGDGHILGILAGGRMAPLGHARQIHTNYIGPLMFYPFLALDFDGKRFCNETVPMSSLNILMSPLYEPENRGVHYRVFDSKKDGSYKSSLGVPPSLLVGEGSAWMDPETVCKADTLEELCKVAGIPVENGTKSIKHYNELCAKGADDDFGVPRDIMVPIDTPPYYCIKGDVGMSGINAGIMVDNRYRVIDADDKPIPHLYAAGIQAGNPCGGINWNMPGGFSNAHIFSAGRYTVIDALTGGASPSKPSGFADLSKLFASPDGTFMWDSPACAHEIVTW